MATTTEAKQSSWLHGLSDRLKRPNGKRTDDATVAPAEGEPTNTSNPPGAANERARRAPWPAMREWLRSTATRLRSIPRLDRGTRFDVRERGNAIRFITDVPGVSRDELEIAVTGQRLIVSAHREHEDRAKDEYIHAYEREPVHFTRSFTLPDFADVDQITSELRDGVLTIVVPTKAGTRSRRIQV